MSLYDYEENDVKLLKAELAEARAQIAELKLKVKAAEFAQSCAAASEKDLREQVAAWIALFERRGELIFGREGD